jgi:integrase
LRRKHVIEMRDEIGATHPAAANNFLRMLRMLINHAVEKEWRTDNPVLGVKPIKYATDGHKTWSEEDVAKFIERHPIGTKAYLAMMLMLITGGRISDAVALGPQNIKDGKLTYTQYKNRRRKPVTLTIPVHPDLAAAIKAMPAVGVRTFLVNHYGKPFSINGGSKWMRKRCDEAGLPEITSHGLRKACARRLAEAGRSAHQIKAITGHRTLKEVERYTQAVDQGRMAEDAMAETETRTSG